MNHTNRLEWCSLPREAIPGVLLGMEPVHAKLHSDFYSALSPSSDIAVAFYGDEPRSDRAPCLAVIPDDKISVVLSWVHTFSPETFPLSQYCQVLSLSDWSRISSFEGGNWGLSQRYRWACIVAGEMLAQTDASDRLGVPLGWAQGCLSYPVARAFMIYGVSSPGLSTQLVQRLAKLGKDSSLHRKRVDPRALGAVWSQVDYDIKDSHPTELAFSVVSAVDLDWGLSLRRSKLLLHSSAELRVQGFDQAADEAMSMRGDQQDGFGARGAMLAGAAYLVGDGTSHIDLLEPYSRECPEAYVWLGLLAGLAGPRSWDSPWMRLVKGVDRLLVGSHSLTDAPQADLSWVEYDWLSSLPGLADEYARLPKQNHRSMAVELFPSVSCQYRLVGTSSEKSPGARAQLGASSEEFDRRHTENKSPGHHESRLRESARLKALNLLQELEQILSADYSSGATGHQTPLFDHENTTRSVTKKRSPSKKGAKGE